MDIFVKVFPDARQEKVEQIGVEQYRVRVKASPEKGKANERLIEILAEYFRVPHRQIIIRSGKTSRLKRVRIHGIE